MMFTMCFAVCLLSTLTRALLAASQNSLFLCGSAGVVRYLHCPNQVCVWENKGEMGVLRALPAHKAVLS